MQALQPKDTQPIAGFKVMEWLRIVRNREYELYKHNPEEYFRQLKEAGKKMRARALSAEKEDEVVITCL